MSLFSRIKQKAFKGDLDNIEWIDDTADIVDTMIWRFPRCGSDIKYGAQLTVRESQVAVLVSKGRFADIYQPGRYQLTTRNTPILATLKGWKHDFNSPFKVDVYFVNTKQFLNMKWNTVKSIMMRDLEFGSVCMHAFGSFCFCIESNPIKFIRNVVGADGNFTTDGITEKLRNFVISKFINYLTKSKIAALDFASNLNEFSSELLIALKDDCCDYGINLTKFSIDKILLPQVVVEMLDKRTRMNVIDNMPTYNQMQLSCSFKASSNNLSGSKKLDSDGSYNVVNTNSNQSKPPIIPQEPMYHAVIDGVKQGPFSKSKLRQMAQQGQLTLNTLVWTSGMKRWEAAKLVPSLSQLFDATLPPL